MSAATRTAWLADMERLRPQIEPHVIEFDGHQCVSQDCPEHLAELHVKLTQIGYANGFFEKETA